MVAGLYSTIGLFIRYKNLVSKPLIPVLAAAVFFLGYSCNTLAGENASAYALKQCSVIDDGIRRLACFDRLAASVSNPQLGKAPTSMGHKLLATYRDSKRRWVFELDNEQIWQQIEPAYLPKPKHLPVQVKISKGVFGSHNLRADYIGKTVKVKRLR